MLQDLTRSAILVAPLTMRGRAAKPAMLAVPVTPTDPDLDACSLDNLAELADLAYRAGDRASAEYFVQQLYTSYDRAVERVARQQAEAAAQPPST